MEVIYIGGIICALITAFVLLRTNTPYQKFSDRLLAGFLMAASYCALLYLLVFTGEIERFPHLFKTAAPINFLLPPLAYFYVRSVLKNETGFKKLDILHFLPFIFFLVSYIPFYFHDASYKLEFAKTALTNEAQKTGLVSEAILFILRELQVLVYLIFQWKLISSFRKEDTPFRLRAHANQVLNWLKAFSGIITINFCCIIAAALISGFAKSNASTGIILNITDTVFGLGYFLLGSYLLLNPAVLYGLPFLEANKLNSSIAGDAVEALDQRNLNDSALLEFEGELQKLLVYFDSEKPFLQKGLSIAEVSVAINLSQRNISFILNSHLGTRFNDFVNSYRVRFVVEKIKAGYLSEFTIESLSESAGFSSVRTFNRAFSKIYNMPPSEFLSLK
jgi:AraC-like DNA-binding protein